MYSVGKCINSSRFIITRSPSKVHILNLLMDTVYLSTSAYSVLCFFMKWIIIVCGLSSEVNILGYATSTSYTAINMTAEGASI